MGSFDRLLLRFIVVPLGYLAAVIAGACVILFGSWKFGTALMRDNSDTFSYGIFGMALARPILCGPLLIPMWLPAAVGVLISEAFAIRSWIFHALNGAASAWIGWQMVGAVDRSNLPLNEPPYVIAGGHSGGFGRRVGRVLRYAPLRGARPQAVPGRGPVGGVPAGAARAGPARDDELGLVQR